MPGIDPISEVDAPMCVILSKAENMYLVEN